MGKSREAYIADVRESMLDYPQLNRLLDDEEELSDTQLGKALDKAIDRYNTMPPLIGNSVFETFPSDSLIVDMAVQAALEKILILRSRNALTYTSDGTTVALDNVQEYTALLDRLTRSNIAAASSLKLALNIKRGFGKVHTPYRDLPYRTR